MIDLTTVTPALRAAYYAQTAGARSTSAPPTFAVPPLRPAMLEPQRGPGSGALWLSGMTALVVVAGVLWLAEVRDELRETRRAAAACETLRP